MLHRLRGSTQLWKTLKILYGYPLLYVYAVPESLTLQYQKSLMCAPRVLNSTKLLLLS